MASASNAGPQPMDQDGQQSEDSLDVLIKELHDSIANEKERDALCSKRREIEKKRNYCIKLILRKCDRSTIDRKSSQKLKRRIAAIDLKVKLARENLQRHLTGPEISESKLDSVKACDEKLSECLYRHSQER